MSQSAGHNILIVEDDSLIGWSMAKALGKAGYNPVVVGCGETAMEIVRSGECECVICDFQLPGMDGLDLAGMVKQKSSSIPVIIIGSHDEMSVEQAASTPEIDYFVEKPFNLSQIVGLVATLVEPGGSNLITGSDSDT